MSNQLYNVARQAFLNGNIDWTGGTTFGVLLVDTTQYEIDQTDEFVSDIIAQSSSAILGRADLVNPTATNGAAGADPTTVTGVTGDVGALIIYIHESGDSNSTLVAYIDTVSGIPATYTDGSVALVWDTSSGNGIFRL